MKSLHRRQRVWYLELEYYVCVCECLCVSVRVEEGGRVREYLVGGGCMGWG